MKKRQLRHVKVSQTTICLWKSWICLLIPPPIKGFPENLERKFISQESMKCHCNLIFFFYFYKSKIWVFKIINFRENINNPAERNFYRFLFRPESQILYVNYFETPTKNWEKENFQQISSYFEVFLKRFYLITIFKLFRRWF